MPLFVQLSSPDRRCTCIIEDDGVVAYAYLLIEGKIVSDLWLYNHAATPKEWPWRQGCRPPFLNPAEFVDADRMSAPLASSDLIAITWHSEEQGMGVSIAFRGIPYGRMSAGNKPGATIAAKRDGPLARVMQ